MCALGLRSGGSGAQGLAEGRASVSDGSRVSAARPVGPSGWRQPPHAAPSVQETARAFSAGLAFGSVDKEPRGLPPGSQARTHCLLFACLF